MKEEAGAAPQPLAVPRLEGGRSLEDMWEQQGRGEPQARCMAMSGWVL